MGSARPRISGQPSMLPTKDLLGTASVFCLPTIHRMLWARTSIVSGLFSAGCFKQCRQIAGGRNAAY